MADDATVLVLGGGVGWWCWMSTPVPSPSHLLSSSLHLSHFQSGTIVTFPLSRPLVQTTHLQLVIVFHSEWFADRYLRMQMQLIKKSLLDKQHAMPDSTRPIIDLMLCRPIVRSHV